MQFIQAIKASVPGNECKSYFYTCICGVPTYADTSFLVVFIQLVNSLFVSIYDQ